MDLPPNGQCGPLAPSHVEVEPNREHEPILAVTSLLRHKCVPPTDAPTGPDGQDGHSALKPVSTVHLLVFDAVAFHNTHYNRL